MWRQSSQITKDCKLETAQSGKLWLRLYAPLGVTYSNHWLHINNTTVLSRSDVIPFSYTLFFCKKKIQQTSLTLCPNLFTISLVNCIVNTTYSNHHYTNFCLSQREFFCCAVRKQISFFFYYRYSHWNFKNISVLLLFNI